MTEILYQPSPSTFGSTGFVTGLLVVGMVSGLALGVSTPEDKVISNSIYTLSEFGDTPYSVQVTKASSVATTNEEFESTMTVFYSSLLANQEDLGSEFEEVLYQNLSSLYES